METSLVKFKDSCDVGSVANIKYCIRTIANRAASTKGLTLKLVKSADMVSFQKCGQIIHVTVRCTNSVCICTDANLILFTHVYFGFFLYKKSLMLKLSVFHIEITELLLL